MDRLGLSEDELCEILAVDPISVIANDLDHRPELKVLLDLTADVDASLLKRWLRRRGPSGTPIEHLRRRDFAAFEDALETLERKGFVIGGGGR